jgi:tetraacyldisaccharide 4'-kinase
LGRAALVPLSLAYGAGMRVRAHAYRAGWRRRHRLPIPAVGIGSQQVGGAGKTPLAAWVAAWYLAHGVRPGILLRGYGRDEGPLHRELTPRAIVVEDADRARGAAAAAAAGAEVAVLDDCGQHLRVVPDQQLLLLGVEALAGTRALLPAGPWREPWDGGRASVVVVTRKSASDAEAARARAAVARAYPGLAVAQALLRLAGWRPLDGGPAVPDARVRGRSLLALCGVADPRPFLTWAGEVGDVVATRCRRDHAPYGDGVVRRIARAAETARVDYVVTTAKDAVKLRSRWPGGAPPVLVADLALSWDLGEDLVTSHLEACLPSHAAAGTAAGTA